MINIKSFILAGIVLAAALGGSSEALFAAAAGKTEKTLTNVTAENMLYDSAAHKVIFSGKVVVTRPDYILTSDKLQIFLSNGASGKQRSAEPNPAGSIQKIIAESKVRVKLPEGRLATCSKATYQVDAETLTMEGSPVLREGQSEMRSERMIFHLRENRNEAQGKVEVDFISGDSMPGFNESGFGILGGDKEKQ